MPVAAPDALDLVLPILRCPVCGAELAHEASALRCPERHTFDIARHGYASLLGGERATSGDDAPMVRARVAFLAAGYYAPVREAIVELVKLGDDGAASGGRGGAGVASPTTALEVGCGTGYHLAGVLDALPEARGLGLDSSVRALQAAAKAHPRLAAATWDVFRPFPVASGSVDLVLDIFSPRNPAEFHRVLGPDGRLIVVRPGDGHLAELRGAVAGMVGIDPEKEERLHRALDPYFETVATERLEYTPTLSPEEAADLVLMTPSAHHLSEAERAGLAAGGLPGEATVSVIASAHRPRPGAVPTHVRRQDG
jgi:23S rRNA (guanine745-N1)-methyltransferase